MPNQGDKLYLVWNGKLETVTFIRGEHAPQMENVPAESHVSYLLERSDGDRGGGGRKGDPRGRFLCAPDMYVTTELEAWRRYHGQCKDSITVALKGLEEAEQHVEYVKAETHKAFMEIERLSPLVGGAKSGTESRA